MSNNIQDPLKTASFQVEQLVNSMVLPMVFKAALELGVIDTITAVDEGVWLSSYEIVHRLSTKPTNPEAPVLLDRMLIFLASHSILRYRMVESGENSRSGNMERVYAAEPVCTFFLNREDGPSSLWSLFMTNQSQEIFKAWTCLKDAVLEGKDAFRSANGVTFFEYVVSNQQFGLMFNRAMSGASISTMKKVLEVYKGFEDVNTLVDVGGGTGTSLDLVTSKYPHIKGINFDLASVLAMAPIYPGVEHVSGDMFIEIPKGDAIFMKWILHDWADEDCVKILKNCWKSLPEKGKVIIVEMIKPIEPKFDDVNSNFVLAMDMGMISRFSGGMERYLSQLETLASDSGFVRCEVICPVHPYYVIEFHK